MPVSKAQQRATNKYKKSNYDRIELVVPKGKKEVIQAHAEAQGESVNGFIGRAIDEAMERDGPTRPQEAAGTALGVGAVSLPLEAVKTAQRAAETSKGGKAHGTTSGK